MTHRFACESPEDDWIAEQAAADRADAARDADNAEQDRADAERDHGSESVGERNPSWRSW